MTHYVENKLILRQKASRQILPGVASDKVEAPGKV